MSRGASDSANVSRSRSVLVPLPLLLLLVSVPYAGAQYLSPSLLGYQQCYSSFALTVTQTPVGGAPSTPLQVVATTFSSKKIAVDCIQIVDNGSTALTDAQNLACQRFVGNITVCVNPVGAGFVDCNTTIVGISTALEQRLEFSRDFPFTITVQWLPNTSLPASCYPRYLTTMLVARDVAPNTNSGSLAAVVVFICVAAFVLLILGCFGQYQIRKVFSKFDRKVSARPNAKRVLESPPRRATGLYDEDEQQPGQPQERIPLELVEEHLREMHGQHAIPARGAQAVELVDGVVVTSKPLVQPWYQRTTYVDTSALRSPPPEVYADPLAVPKPLHMARIPQAHDGVRRRQNSPPQPTAVSPTFGGGADTSGYQHSSLPEEPRRLQFPSPTHIRRNDASPPPRVLNPYE